MIKIGICDDDKGIGSQLEKYFREIGDELGIIIDCEIWYSGEELCKYLGQAFPLDLLFLDIELAEENTGIEIGTFIRQELEDYRTGIVYVSYEPNYALQLFSTQPVDFLLKPLEKEKIAEVLRRYLKQTEDRDMYFEFKKRHSYNKISYSDIVYFQSVGRKVAIQTVKERLEFYGNLQEVEIMVPPSFVRIHKSYLVNDKYVTKFEYEYVTLYNEEKYPISRTYRNLVKQQVSQKGRK